MNKRYLTGTEPKQPDESPQEQTGQSNTGVSGTTHGGRTDKDTAHSRLEALRAGIKS